MVGSKSMKHMNNTIYDGMCGVYVYRIINNKKEGIQKKPNGILLPKRK